MFDQLKYFLFKKKRNRYLKQMYSAVDPWSSRASLDVLTKKIIEVLQGQKFTSCLDVGCGEGLYAPLLKQFTDAYLGIDVVVPATSEFKKMDFDEVPRLNKKFDLIVFNFVMDYLGFQDHPRLFTANLYSFVQQCVLPGAAVLIFNPVYKTETWDRVQKYQFLLETFGFETLKRELVSTGDMQVAFLHMKFKTR